MRVDSWKSWVFAGLSSEIFFLIGSTFLLFWPNIWNGLSFYYADSGYYLLHNPFRVPENALLWRPLTYNLFLKGTVLAFGYFFSSVAELVSILLPSQIADPLISVLSKISWFTRNISFVVFIQCFVANLIIHRFSHWLYPQLGKIKYLLALFFLSLFSPAAVYSNFVMTDIFSSLVVLCLIPLFDTSSWKKSSWLASLMVFVSMHYSHVLSLSAFLLSRFRLIVTKSPKIISIFACLVGAILVIGCVHFLAKGKFQTVNSAQIYMFSRLYSLDIIQEYLEDTCPNEKYEMCQQYIYDFHIWQQNEGLIQRMGGLDKMKDELGQISMDVLTSSYVFPFIGRSVMSSLWQTINFWQPLLPEHKNEYLEMELRMAAPTELKRFKQQQLAPLREKGLFRVWGFVFLFSTLASIGWLIYCWQLRPKLFDDRLQIALTIFISYYLCNAIVIGFLTETHSRYSNRLIWPLILLALIKAIQACTLPATKTLEFED